MNALIVMSASQSVPMKQFLWVKSSMKSIQTYVPNVLGISMNRSVSCFALLIVFHLILTTWKLGSNLSKSLKN